MILFFALIGVAVAISGVLGFLFFWAMAQVHQHDRQTSLGKSLPGIGFASPAALAWLLMGGYRRQADKGLDGLALPAQICLWAAIAGLMGAGVLVAVAQFA